MESFTFKHKEAEEGGRAWAGGVASYLTREIGNNIVPRARQGKLSQAEEAPLGWGGRGEWK